MKQILGGGCAMVLGFDRNGHQSSGENAVGTNCEGRGQALVYDFRVCRCRLSPRQSVKGKVIGSAGKGPVVTRYLKRLADFFLRGPTRLRAHQLREADLNLADLQVTVE